MIFFCEDCGEKNFLTQSQLKNGKAVFRCDACDYMNSYAFQTSEKQYLKIIDPFFKDIQGAPDIIGSFLFHRKTGILKNNMPDILKEPDLLILGKTITNNYLIGRSQYPDINEMTMVIANKNMIVKMIDDDLMVIIAGYEDELNRALQEDGSPASVYISPKTYYPEI